MDLFKQYGRQYWWPVLGNGAEHDKTFEICVGAILTQNTAWTNVEKALNRLLDANLMTLKAISECSVVKLRKCIQSAGYFRQKTKKLKIFSGWIIKKYDGNWKKFFAKPILEARQELLNLWGIGKETADSILLYAGNKSIFVIDVYTKRLCKKYGVEFKDYDDYRDFFEKGLSRIPSGWSRVEFYNEFHALIVRFGKEKSIAIIHKIS